MSREKYVFNEATLQYEKLELSWKARLFRYAMFLSVTLLFAFIMYTVAYTIIPTPKEIAAKRDLSQMQYQYNTISSDFEKIAGQLENLQEKDAEVHRIIFGIDPLDKSVWEGGIGGHTNKYYSNLQNSEEMITETQSRVEKLKYKLELQKRSLDTIHHLAKQREEKLLSIPSIKPIKEDKLKRKMRALSGYGWRIHPVHKLKKFHKGIDFTAPKGTPIIATGNGTIIKVEKRLFGYGKNVVIDHGFGYTTLYAHMKDIEVKKGERVTKGQVIGTVGSTGTSTAPHLHYEVRINGKAVNPIDYCMDGLSLEEYQSLVDKASVENQSFDY